MKNILNIAILNGIVFSILCVGTLFLFSMMAFIEWDMQILHHIYENQWMYIRSMAVGSWIVIIFSYLKDHKIPTFIS